MKDSKRAIDLGALVPVRTLGHGALTEVLLVELADGGRAALKRALPQLRGDPQVARVLREEAAVHAQLAHPAIPRLLAHGETPDGPVLVVEAIRGATLDEVLPEGSPASTQEALFIVDRIADVLQYLHAPPRALVHRDLGAHNIIVSTSGDPVLIDFGIALDDRKARWTAVGGLRGALAAISPEAVRGEPIGPRADLFALGALAYELWTGAPAFFARGRRQLLEHVARGEFRPLADTAPARAVPPHDVAALTAFFSRALAADPAARFADADALARAFARAVGEPLDRDAARTALATRVAPLAGPTGPERTRTRTLT